MMEENLIVYDEQLRPVGAESRERVHRIGLLHKVVQCWVVSPRPEGLWIWYQKRAPAILTPPRRAMSQREKSR